MGHKNSKASGMTPENQSGSQLFMAADLGDAADAPSPLAAPVKRVPSQSYTDTQLGNANAQSAARMPLPPTPDEASAASGAEPTMFIGLHTYKAKGPNELSFEKGEQLLVNVVKGENWWEAQSLRTNQVGWLPSNYVEPLKDEEEETRPWYHGKIPRTTSEYLLRNGVDGSFLVRESESSPGEHSISMRFGGKVYHYRITKLPDGRVCIADDRVFPDLDSLIEHHSKNADGLMYSLKHAVKKKRVLASTGVSKEADDKWEIDREEIRLGKRLGAGQYGEVYEAFWERINKTVAVKTLKDTMEPGDFLKEANVMKSMRHPNLVQLLGVCTKDTPMFIIAEYMPRGNLLDFLRDETNREQLDPTSLMYIAAQVAAGMSYLEDENMIHRDLAARNCLVGENLSIKIADFGLSRLLSTEDLYSAREGSKFPIKWTAPESLNYNVFTIKSDVWSFGVVLWELATYGGTPYPGMDLFSVPSRLEAGYRMPRPDGCPVEVYDLMLKCWQLKPEDRPSFKDIKQELENLFPEDGDGLQEQVDKVLTLDKMAKLVPPDEAEAAQNTRFGRATFSATKSQPSLGVKSASSSAVSPSAAGPPLPRRATSSSNAVARARSDGAADQRQMQAPGRAASVAARPPIRRMTSDPGARPLQRRGTAMPMSSISGNKDVDDILKRTKHVFQQARMIRDSDDASLFTNVKLTLTDTKNLIDITRATAGDSRTVQDAVQNLVDEVKQVARLAQQLSKEGASRELRDLINQHIASMTRMAKRMYEAVRSEAPSTMA